MHSHSTNNQIAVVVGILGVALFAATPHSLHASTWTYLGTRGAELFVPTDVFIDWNSVEDLGADQFLVKTLNVLPNTVAGIDFFDPEDGHVYDMRYPHQSYILEAIYDCSRHMTAVVRSTYFSGERPARENEVYDAIESDVVFMGQYLGIPSESLVLDAVCDMTGMRRFDFLS